MNSLWNNKCKTIAEVFTTYLRPVNLNFFKVDVNKEIELGLSTEMKAKDKRLRTVQSSMAAAVHAQGKMLEDLHCGKSCNYTTRFDKIVITLKS
jgi:hypothetical protein